MCSRRKLEAALFCSVFVCVCVFLAKNGTGRSSSLVGGGWREGLYKEGSACCPSGCAAAVSELHARSVCARERDSEKGKSFNILDSYCARGLLRGAFISES